jgi:hypothetical protein
MTEDDLLQAREAAKGFTLEETREVSSTFLFHMLRCGLWSAIPTMLIYQALLYGPGYAASENLFLTPFTCYRK